MKFHISVWQSWKVFCALIALLGSATLTHGAITYSVTIDDPANAYSSYYAPITSHVQAAGAEWAKYFTGNASLAVIVRINTDHPLGSGRSVTTSFVKNNGVYNVFEQAAAHEVRTGFDQNGSAPDIEITLNPSYLTSNLWFDPNPITRTSAIPSSRTDAMSVFLHELSHAFGFNGWRDHFNGSLPGNYESTYDEKVVFDGTNFWFTGANAVAEYGGPVPLTYGLNHHIGNFSPRPGSELEPDLMNGLFFHFQTRYYISYLDLAIMKDVGLPVTVPEPSTFAAISVLLALGAARRPRM